jgi:hypothetical protein
MDKKKICEEIDKDMNRGIYDTFPKLKERLTFIRRKLYGGIYIINAVELSKGEIQTLIENDYLDKNDYETL